MSETKVSLPAIYGIKAGMTRIFDANGNHVPVTVVKLIPNVISQVKTKEKDGYSAYQVAYHEKRESLLTKPTKGTLKKAGISSNLTHFSEVKVETVAAEALGTVVGLEEFKPNTIIDVTGTSKGKGFQGVMKRYNFQGGPASHGSHFHRRPGSIGCRATPARVFANKKMPGQMGSDQVTVQNIVVLEVNTQDGYMLIKGSVPGSKNGFIKIAKAVKKS
ncbi:MAG: 50S ribosomal protein L3 [Bacteriovoracia bacterium]|jgi:large subunit ribosomal protein L3